MVKTTPSQMTVPPVEQLEHNETPREKQSKEIAILCDGVSLPANMGGILRLADSFGVKEVIFANSKTDPNSRKVRQVARSTHQWISYRVEPESHQALRNLIELGFEPMVLELSDHSLPLPTLRINPGQKMAIVIGSEISGVSQEVLSLCSNTYHIPIYGNNSSMNVTQALAIGLYQLSSL